MRLPVNIVRKGKEKAAFIQADVDRKVTLILANANKTAQELRGNGDAAAAKLYSQAFAQEPQFYSFIRSFKSLSESSFEGSDNMMILKPTVISSALCKRQRNKQEIMKVKCG